MRSLVLFLIFFNALADYKACRNLNAEILDVLQVQEQMSKRGIAGELKSYINSQLDEGVEINEKFLQRIQPRQILEEKTFTNYSRFEDHFEKHGKEFGRINQMQYLKKAQNLAQSRDPGILTLKTDKAVYKYDPKKNEILIVSDGHIRTFYRPNLEFKNKQLLNHNSPPVTSVLEWLVKHESDPI